MRGSGIRAGRRRAGRRRGGTPAALGVAVALVLAGCSAGAEQAGPDDVLAGMQARQDAARAVGQLAGTTGAGPSPTAATCSPDAKVSYQPLASLPAPGSLPAGSLEAAIAARGYLVVGVSGDTRLLGARNSLRGGALEGFDIEIARAIATAIFGSSTPQNTRLKVITAAQRVPLLTAGVDQGGVDLVARAMTMTCDRWKQVAFSAEYFRADQIMLTRSATDTVDQLARNRATVCAPTGSTSLDRIRTVAGLQPVAVDIHSDCLALWQGGRVDAITGDDAILAGFKDQDPRAVLGKEKLGAEPYGLAMSAQRPEFVSFVNAVLASPAGRAAWADAYARSGLAATLGTKTQPAAVYGR